jgi:PhnB protein
MQMSPYLHFNGNCEAAFKFYEKALGAEIESMLHHEGPPAAEQGNRGVDAERRI